MGRPQILTATKKSLVLLIEVASSGLFKIAGALQVLPGPVLEDLIL